MCLQCESCAEPEMDLTIRHLIGCVLADDDSVLESETLWSGRTLSRATHLCPFGLDLEAVLLALREEAWRRGIVDTII
jgi:heterodisulfide reductase subunit C